LGLPHEAGHFLGLNHGHAFIMTPCGGRADRRVSKAMADVVNP
jgi:predicted Zn-dependent protease